MGQLSSNVSPTAVGHLRPMFCLDLCMVMTIHDRPYLYMALQCMVFGGRRGFGPTSQLKR